MSLLEMQRVFCRVLTDDAAREAYLAGPSAFLGPFDLTPRERAALERMNVSRLQMYSRMLINGRIQLALKALPHAKTFLPADFYPRYGPRYAREHPPDVDHGSSPMLRELRRLAGFIEGLVAEGALTHPQLLDALHYDATLFTLGNDLSTYAAVRAFEVRVRARGTAGLLEARLTRSPGVIVQTFTQGLIGHDGAPAPGATPEPKTVVILFQKRSGTVRTNVHLINAPTERFLERCDGTHTLLAVAETLCGGSPVALDRCIALGRQLAAREVIGPL